MQDERKPEQTSNPGRDYGPAGPSAETKTFTCSCCGLTYDVNACACCTATGCFCGNCMSGRYAVAGCR